MRGKKTQAADSRLGVPPRKQLWAAVLLSVLLFAIMYTRNVSGDVWWQLKTGQWIVLHRALPRVDPFSYTAHNPIMLHEWGAEVIAWLIYNRIAPSALAALSVCMILLAFLIAFRLAVARSCDLLASFIVVAIGALASAAGSEMRPQMFSFLLFSAELVVLQRFHDCGERIIWLLPPLIFIWANLHSAVTMGLALMGFETAIALVAPPEWSRKRRHPRLASAGPLAAAWLLSVLLGLVNPSGLGTYAYPLEVLRHPDNRNIFEWASPSFHELPGQSLLVLFAIVAVGLAVCRERPAFRDFAYVGLFAAASLLARRMAVFFSLACAAPIAIWFSTALRQGFLWLSACRLDAAVRLVVWLVTTLAVIAAFSWRISDSRGFDAFDYMVTAEMFPSAACDFLLSHRITGPMFNDINYGGYLIYRLWPRHKVFVDTRQGPFLKGAWEEAAQTAYRASPGVWHTVFEKHRINFAVLGAGLPLVTVLMESRDWVPVYQDDRAVIFVRDVPANSAVISGARQP